VLALVLAAVACGGGGESSTTTTTEESSAVQWAGGVCSAFTTWKNSVKSIESSVASQPSKSQIQKAGQDFQSATKTLTESLKQLGKPDTAQGQAAKKNLDTLESTLQSNMNKIQDTLNQSSSGAASTLSQISTLSATLATMANNLKLAGGNLKSFAPSGELQQAFHQATACQPYLKS
jgi:ElaB/YqjD/DUF883 family membrane-anchored ribosome-binding protein